jgi:hypothetical protein
VAVKTSAKAVIVDEDDDNGEDVPKVPTIDKSPIGASHIARRKVRIEAREIRPQTVTIS